MAELAFEIWRDEATCSYTMSPISEQADKLRRTMSPMSVKVHTFTAKSDYEASQKNYDWHGWGRWKPEPDWVERFFTDEEVEEQRRYLAVRTER